MIRFFLPALVVLFAGCCQKPGATTWTNPFDANSRIAPPPTGSAVPNGAAPYYQPPAGGQLTPLSQNVPSVQGDPKSEPTPALATAENRPTTSGTGFREVSTSGTKANHAQLASHSEPTNATDSGRTFAGSAARDISTLPPAKLPRREGAVSEPRRPVGESRTNFAYRPDYSTLQGRLEYSPTTGQWKLRYIPIDGNTDRFGGSVVLVDSERLADFEDGDFVVVEGELGSDDQDNIGFAPAYHLNTIRRL
jgi:hypothetical protein